MSARIPFQVLQAGTTLCLQHTSRLVDVMNFRLQASAEAFTIPQFLL